MASVKVKKVKLPTSNTSKDMSDIFSQLIGGGNVNMYIAYPRYRLLNDITDQIINVVEMLATSPFMKKYGNMDGGEYAEIQKGLLEWIEISRGAVQKIFSANFKDYEWNFSLVEEEQQAEFSKVYAAMKESPIIRSFIIMCDRLVLYKKELSADASGKSERIGRFIDLMPGVEWAPLPFSPINFKFIFAQHGDDITRRFFVVVLNKLYELSYKVWQEITSPDVNLDEFSEVIINSIEEIRKRPELSRCGRAFKKIEESLNMLKTRFSSYYRDFIHTKNSSIIIENFVLDVAQEHNSDIETTRQFREIIKYYRKNANGVIKDPRIREMFDKVSESFNEVERQTENLGREEAEHNDGFAEKAEKIVDPDPMEQYAAARAESATKSVDELAAEIEKL